jgi:hypothetical protein
MAVLVIGPEFFYYDVKDRRHRGTVIGLTSTRDKERAR